MATKAKKTAKTTASAKKVEADVFGVEQMKEKFEAAFGSFGNFEDYSQEVTEFSKANVEAVVASATAAGKGIEALGNETAAYTKDSVEKGVEATTAAFQAKSVQEFIEIQSDFTKNAFEAYVAQINKVTDLFSEATAEAAAPLNARVNAVVEKVQGA